MTQSHDNVINSDATRITQVSSYLRQNALQRLQGIKTAGLILYEDQQEHFLGDKSADLQAIAVIHDQRFWQLLASGGSLGVGEAYMLGLWDSHDLTNVIRVFARNREVLSALGKRSWWLHWLLKFWHARNRNHVVGSQRNIAAHYDLSNDFFRLWLDESMLYSSAIYQQPGETLEQAQFNKLERICQQLQLKAGDRVLEIGSGWGAFACHAAKHHNCQVTTTTISNAQYDYTASKIRQAGLDNNIRLLKDDYRDLKGTYDAIVSIEMIEAVGHHYVDDYFAVIERRLRPGGRALIQAITIEDHRYEQALKSIDFIKRYIFPGSFIPSLQRLRQAWQKTGLDAADIHAIGPSYTRTLAEWRHRFDGHKQAIHDMGFDSRFMRMWTYYLCFCEGGFAEGALDDLQIHLYKPATRK